MEILRSVRIRKIHIRIPKWRWYDRRVVLAAFVAGLVLVLAATVYATVRAVALWRHTKRTGGVLGRELASFEERTARAERHLSEWEGASARLQDSLERLRVSHARLGIQLAAIEGARARVRWLRVFLPL
jgi:ABC-type transport system involved in cytochrome bd biosynthesis fused ATPase/permease subunit